MIQQLISCFVLLVFFHPVASWAFVFGDPKLSSEESSQIVKLLETFSNGCSLTRGPSADAISVVQGLSSAVRAAVSNPNCQSLAGLVTTLDSTTLQAQSLIPKINDSYVSELESKVASLQRQKEEIATLLTQTTDPTELAYLRSELYSARIELAGALSEAKDSALNDQQIRKAQALRLLLGSTNQAVNQIIANESCWVGQPSLLQQVAGVGSTLGASAALTTVASEKAVLLSAGLGILSTIVDFFERLSKAKEVAQFDLALGSTALTCAMEKMNDVYCSAQDTLNAIQKVGARFHDPKEDPVWRGVRFLEREIPVLLAWLQKIKSGGGAGTIEDAEKQSAIELKDVNLTNSARIAEGFLRDAQLRYDQASVPDQRFEIVKSVVRSIASRLCVTNMGGVNNDNPLCSTVSFDYSPFYLLGLSSRNWQDLLKINSNLGVASLDLELLSSIGVDGSLITVNTVRIQFGRLYSLARERFDIEKRLALGQDLALIFDEAMKKNFQTANPTTAQSALEDLIKFLQRHRSAQDPQLDLKEQVVRSLQEILKQIENVAKKETTPEDAKNVIYQVADLKVGTSFIGDRLERLIRTELERLVRDPDQVDDATRLPFLAASDVIAELRRYYQVSSLQEMQESSTNAQLVMIKTIDPFIRMFSAPMVRAFDEFDSIQKKVGGEGAKQALALKTKLCFYFLNSTRPQDFFTKECEGLVAKSILGIETVPFSKALFQQPLEKRACLYRNFIMKNRIYEKRRVPFHQKYGDFYKLFIGLNTLPLE